MGTYFDSGGQRKMSGDPDVEEMRETEAFKFLETHLHRGRNFRAGFLC